MHVTSSSSSQTDVTLVLVVVVFVFIVCQTPTFVDHILWTVLDESARTCGRWHYYYTAIGDLMAICNSSVNFVIYVLTSPKFRQTLASMCLRAPTSICCAAAAAKLRLIGLGGVGGVANQTNGGSGAASVIIRVTRRGRTVGTTPSVGGLAATAGRSSRLSNGLRGLKGNVADVDDCAAETILLYRPTTMHGSTDTPEPEMI